MNSTSIENAIQQAAQMLRDAQHAVVFTGAGISTPSGIPDFRSKKTGLWERYDPMEFASIGVFQSRPDRFYDWLRPLLRQTWNAQPNPAHLSLARLEKAGVIKAIITQNIDDLHQRAGAKHVLEVHGSMHTLSCLHCNETYPSEQFKEQMSTADEMPRCSICSRILKPDITLFGEMLPMETWDKAEEHCLLADVMLVAGSSLEVWPAASLPEIALEHGAQLILNNLSPTPLDQRAAVRIPLDVAQAIPQIADLVLQSKDSQ